MIHTHNCADTPLREHNFKWALCIYLSVLSCLLFYWYYDTIIINMISLIIIIITIIITYIISIIEAHVFQTENWTSIWMHD